LRASFNKTAVLPDCRKREAQRDLERNRKSKVDLGSLVRGRTSSQTSIASRYSLPVLDVGSHRSLVNPYLASVYKVCIIPSSILLTAQHLCPAEKAYSA